MKIGNKITICDSDELRELSLTDLVGASAKIVAIERNVDACIRGCWVELECGAYLEEVEWYIPVHSIEF